VLYKRDPRAAFGWVAVCLMFPVAGPVLYFLFGINRIHTRAQKLRHRARFRMHMGYERLEAATGSAVERGELDRDHVDIVKVGDTVSRNPLVAGNRVKLLENGEEAYPAMLEAIEEARESIYLCTYIFKVDETGRRFVDALARAVERGVDVRVLVDGIGELYSLPRTVCPLLRRRGVSFARFLPPTLLPPTLYFNLRIHRKVLVSDGRVGFTGGMNIGDAHLAESVRNRAPVRDVHFRIAGPVVEQLERAFLDDWRFCTGDESPVRDETGPGARETTGEALCRLIVDGPNEDLDKLASVMLGAISTARRRIALVTPYFLPSREMISALQTAALRGVEVSVVLPSRNNLPFVQWAMQNMLWEVVQRGVGVYYQPPPFDHSKLFLVDEAYAQIGSANIDPRSLRLNFELALEIFGRDFAASLWGRVESMRAAAHRVSLAELDGRPLPIRARDAVAWLFSPYM